METRIDLLNKPLLRLMSKSGLESINIGIETPDEKIAAVNKRKVCSSDKQKDLINFAFNEGIRINAFYIIGLEDDDMQSCLNTIKYSLSLKTYMARFAVCTPYPGTEYFNDLNKNNRIENKNLSHLKEEWLEGLTVQKYFPWTIGSIICFDSLQIHSASNFLNCGIESKLGLSIFTVKE